MAVEPGGIASKLGTIYERRFAIEQLVRLIAGKLIRLRWEPASGEAGGADVELGHSDGTTEHVQLKRQNRADAKWTPAALEREGVLSSAARVVDSAPAARFTFLSSDPVPHLKDICDQIARHGGTEADFIRDRISKLSERRACFENLLRRWELEVGDPNDEVRAVRRLRAMSFKLLDRGQEGEARVNMLVQAYLTGDPQTVTASLAAFLEENLGKDVTAHALLDHLAQRSILPRDLARDPLLPTAMLVLRKSFVDSLRPRLIAGGWIPRSQVADIVTRIASPDAPGLILLHGKPGAGKSGVLLRVVEELIVSGIPLLPLSVSARPPEGSVLQYGETLGLRATPAAALRALAGESRAVLLVDQLDALRLTTSSATAKWGVCAEMLREAARDPRTVLIVACRTFDLENDANIRQWKEASEKAEAGGVLTIEIGDFSGMDVKPVLQGMGVDYGALPPRLQRLLLHPSTLDAWLRLMERGSTRRDFATQTQLLNALIDELRAEAARDHGVSDCEVYNTLNAARLGMERTGRLTVPTSMLDAHRGGLKACYGVGLLVRTGRTVSFPHQSYYDYLVAVAALADSGHSPDQIVAWVKQDQSLERRDQLRQLLFLLHDEQPVVAATVSDRLLHDPYVRFHLKHLVLGVLREADPISPGDVALVERLVRDEPLREHTVGRVLWRSVTWFDAVFKQGIWAELIAQSEGDEKARWLRTISVMMESRPTEVDQLLEPVLITADGTELMAKTLWWDPSEDSPKVAALRDAQVRSGVWAVPDMMLGRVAQRDPVRTIRLMDGVIRGKLRRSWRRFGTDNDQRIENFRDGAFDNEVAHAVRNHAAASFPVLERLIRLCEYLQRSCKIESYGLEDRTPRDVQLKRFFHDLLEALTTLTSHAIAGLADAFSADLREVLTSRAASASPSLTRAIAAGLVLSPDTASDQALEWLLADPPRLKLEDEFGRDSRSLSKEIVSRHARTCSQETLDRLESVLLALIPVEEKRRYKFFVEQYFSTGKWGYNKGGRYHPHINPIGRTQHALLGALPAERRSARVKDRLRVWDGKFGGRAQSRHGSDAKGGWVQSPIPRDRVDRVTDKQWLDIVSRRWSRRWRQVGPDRIAETSPEHFANDMKVAALKQPRRFVRLALNFPEDAPSVYLLRICDALTEPAADVASCEGTELDALLTRAMATDDGRVLLAACRAVERHPNAAWGLVVWELLDTAATHQDPQPGEHVAYGTGQPDLELTSNNCVRGVAAAALAALAWDNDEHCAIVKDRAARLAEDPHPAVRMAAAHTANAVYTVDRDAGVELLLKLAEFPDDRIYSGFWVNHLIRSVRWSHRGVLHPLFERMCRSTEDNIAKQGAYWITVERFQFNSCEKAYFGCRDGSVAQRQGVAEAITHLVDDAHADRAAVENELITLFNDVDEKVRTAAAGVFRASSVLDCDTGSRLADAFVQSTAFAEHSEDLIWPLSNAAIDLVKYRAAVFGSADRVALELAGQTRHMESRLGMAGGELSSLLLRLYDAAVKIGDRSLSEACLDKWDCLLASRVGDAERHLESIVG